MSERKGNNSGVNAVVLAGGEATPAMKVATGVPNRALVPLGDRVMLDYVIDALSDSDIKSIWVVGNVPSSSRYEKVVEKGDLFDNMVAGLTAADSPRCLVATSDIPFLTTEAVNAFLNAALDRDADIVYPIIPMTSYRGKFGAMKRTTLRVREGEFTGGNLMLLRTDFIVGQADRIRAAYTARKDVLRLGAMLGPGLLLRVLAAQTLSPALLSLPMLEAAVARLLGDARVTALVTPYPEIGTDVDRPEDVEIARRLLDPGPDKRKPNDCQ
ncbi:MAG: molybdenum cofactor guanylyltransferase [Capsulimonadaceae bacterium]